MKFRVLGTLEVVGPSGVIDIGAAKVRLLLCALLVRANDTVTGDELVDAIWPAGAPRTAAKTLQTYISQLRQLLGAQERIVTRPNGYALVADVDEIDALAFERDVAAGRSALLRDETSIAARSLSKALALWRGRPYTELDDGDFASAARARLESVRLSAVEDHIEARMALGDDRDLVSELEQHLAVEPLRERLWAQLMQVLYRAGRQADALRAFQQARQTLALELGIEPGPELQRLERAVLDQDPSLELVTHDTTSAKRGRTQYARTREGVNIAFQTYGHGEQDLVFVPAAVSHIEAQWDDPEMAGFYRRLGDFSRLILFDKRGTGLSDPVSINSPPTLEDMVDDVLTVMDAVGSERAGIFGLADGGAVGAMFAAAHPERVTALIMYNSAARYLVDDDYAIGMNPAVYDAFLQMLEAHWGTGIMVPFLMPDRIHDTALRERVGRLERLSASPALAMAVQRLAMKLDIRALLPAIRVPTLVLVDQSRAEWMVPLATFLAEHIDDARMTQIDQGSHGLGHTSPGALDAVEKFLTGDLTPALADRMLATVLVVRLLDDTADNRGDVVVQEQYALLVRRQLDRFRGVLVQDGAATVATFDAPGRAIACATTIADGVRGLGVSVQAGLHAGEVDTRRGEIDGVPFVLAHHGCGLAAPGEVVVTHTVVDLVAGSSIVFEDRGEHEAIDAPGSWRFSAVVRS